MAALFDIEQLAFEYHNTRILTDVSCTVSPGEWLAITGRNGSGKSTLIRLLLGLEQPSAGKISWCGQPLETSLATMRQQVGLLLQQPETQILGQTVLDDSGFGLPTDLLCSGDWHEQRQKILQEFDLWRHRRQNPATLSGGQLSLMTLASAVLRKPRLLILDEPFAHLDYPAIQLCLANLIRLQRQGVAIMLISHQLEPFLAHCQRLLIFAAGRLICDQEPERACSLLATAGLRPPAVAVRYCSWLADDTDERGAMLH